VKKERVTAGITAQFVLIVQIDGQVCDLDVELGYPEGVEALEVGLFDQ